MLVCEVLVLFSLALCLFVSEVLLASIFVAAAWLCLDASEAWDWTHMGMGGGGECGWLLTEDFFLLPVSKKSAINAITVALGSSRYFPYEEPHF